MSMPDPHHRAAAAPRLCRPLVAAGLVLGLCGCASVVQQPAALPAIAVPAAWAVAEAAAPAGSSPLAQWWTRFDDPLLASLVTQALQTNTSVASAQAALRQARALRDVSAAGLLPAVGGSASAQRSRSGGNPAGNSIRAALDAGWELDVFGANQSALDASEAAVLASAATLGDVQVAVTAEVALGYITLRSAQTLLTIASDNLALQQETLQLTQWRMQAGLVTSLETEQARGAVEQTRAQLPVLQTSIRQSGHALSVLTGQPPAALSSVLAEPRPVPQPAGDLALAIPAETLRQRADVRAAEQQVAAALARVAQADAARLPNFRLSGSIGLAALTLGALTNGTSVLSALAASVTMPVFDGGAGLAQVRAQQAALDQAGLAYQATVLAALKEVEDALVALRGDRERVARLQQAAEAATNAALLARQRYAGGMVDFQTVVDTQRSQLTAQESVAAASANLSADHVRLYKALGGGWQPEGSDAIGAASAESIGTSHQ
jgi:NodT family efflux transporter outer membrane factor (OMF) lipoprotein